MSFSLAFAADIVPTQTNLEYFISGNVEHLFGKKLLQYWESVDFCCFNLETPLTNHKEKVFYPGPHLSANPQAINAIKELKPTLITIGNNHILDQGQVGCLQTIDTLNKAHIEYIGAGENIFEAKKPYVLRSQNYNIGILNFTEYEFASAGKMTSGANPFDFLDSFDEVSELKKECDIVIVLFHGGKEFYRFPSPLLQRICRKFCDKGANLVICQHSHCIGCEEKYKNSTIVYGQGNLLFDRYENEYKKTGMIVECIIEETMIKEVKYIPVIKVNECVRMADSIQKEKILKDFYERSENIKKENIIEEEFQKLAIDAYPKYVRKIIKMSVLQKIIDKVTKGRYTRNYYSPEETLKVLNIISPENHSELFKEGLRVSFDRMKNNM